MFTTQIDINTVIPDAKDTSRAAKLSLFKGKWLSTPSTGAASKMAQAIDDPYKLVRRSKAVAQRYGADSSAFRQFKYRLQELLFTAEQIKQIAISA